MLRSLYRKTVGLTWLHSLYQQQKQTLQPCHVRPSLAVHTAPLLSSSVRFYTTKAASSSDSGDVYFNSSFWDTTYTNDSTPLEWYFSYSELCPVFSKHIPKSSPVLMVGCGNSLISEDMAKDGYKEIVNIDISPVVILAMQKKYENVPQLKYMTMNAVDLSSFEGCSFGSVVDKGTFDAVMSDTGGPYNAAMMLGEIIRILKPGGIYMLITFAGPDFALPLLNKNAFGWDITLYNAYQSNSTKDVGTQSKPCIMLVPPNPDGSFPNDFPSQSSNNLFIYICSKVRIMDHSFSL